MNTELKNTTDTLQDYLSYIQDDTQVKKIRTGFDKLDNLLNGGVPNGLITLGATPSLGKTTFALQVADNMASMENTKVLFFSLEMSRFDIISKSLSRLSYTSEELSNYTFDDLLGLKEPNKDSLEYDLNFIIENGMDDYIKRLDDEKRRDREFVDLFKRNYNDIVRIIEFDPHKRIPVNCYTCIKGMDLSKQYGKTKRKE